MKKEERQLECTLGRLKIYKMKPVRECVCTVGRILILYYFLDVLFNEGMTANRSNTCTSYGPLTEINGSMSPLIIIINNLYFISDIH